jgi:hypothetical protein
VTPPTTIIANTSTQQASSQAATARSARVGECGAASLPEADAKVVALIVEVDSGTGAPRRPGRAGAVAIT